jgi:hypothetical protein
MTAPAIPVFLMSMFTFFYDQLIYPALHHAKIFLDCPVLKFSITLPISNGHGLACFPLACQDHCLFHSNTNF